MWYPYLVEQAKSSLVGIGSLPKSWSSVPAFSAFNKVGVPSGGAMPKLNDQDHLEWLTPNQLFERMLDKYYLETTPESPWENTISLREELKNIREGEAFEDGILGMTQQTPEDIAVWKERRKEWKNNRNSLVKLAEENFIKTGMDGCWLGFGRRSPFVEEEIIPCHFWGFVTFDRTSRVARISEFGIQFSNVRCLILEELSRDRQIQAIHELENAERSAFKKAQDNNHETSEESSSFFDNEIASGANDANGEPNNDGSSNRPSAAFKNNIESAYKSRIENWPETKPFPSREEDEKWGRSQFNVARERMRELRKIYAPDAWSKTGPKNKG